MSKRLLLPCAWQCCSLGHSVGLQNFEEVARKASAESAEATDACDRKADKLKADLESTLNQAAKLRVLLPIATFPLRASFLSHAPLHWRGCCLEAMPIRLGGALLVLHL